MGKIDRAYLKDRSRGWCWTMNNWTDDDLAEVIILSDDTQYLVCGFEVAPTTGTPHLQCYCFFKHQKTGKRFSEYFTKKHHIEKAQGTPEHNRNYCYGDVPKKTHNDDVFEVGVVPQSGKITMEHLDGCMREPENNIQIFHQYRKTYDELLNIRRKNDRTITKFFVIDDFAFTSADFCQKLFDMFDQSTHSLESCRKDDHTECYANELSNFYQKVAVVSELSELELYKDYEIVVLTQLLISDHHRLRLWFSGQLPIYYNYGYMKKIVKPPVFIVVADNINHRVFRGFKKIDFCADLDSECETPNLTEMSDTDN